MPLDALDAFPTPADLVELVGEVADDAERGQAGEKIYLEEVSIDLPFELTVSSGESGEWLLGTSPPTQLVETSVMPVWHQLRLRIGVEYPKEQSGETTGDADA